MLGRRGHEHEWVEVSRHHVDPIRSSVERVWGVPVEDLRRLMWGATVVVLRCEVCGDLCERILTGDAMPEARRAS